LYVTRIDPFKEQEIDLPCDSFYNPTWSRDGKSILMIAAVKDKRTFLRYDLASGEASTFLFDHELLRKGTAFGDFSPDGHQILFDGFGPQGELTGVYIYDGSSVKKVPGTEGARPAQWSPDGQRIAFARQGNVWLVRPDGTGLRKITNLPAGEALARLSWAPNGRFIAYTSSALFVIGVDEDFREKLPGAEGLNSGRVAWSPDGRYLALGSAQGSSELWVMENFLPTGK
jgi:Tol biopolymer transport system component